MTTVGKLYHVNGATAGYDIPNRLADFRRGVLSDSNADGVMDTITTSSNTVNWTMDSQGNCDEPQRGDVPFVDAICEEAASLPETAIRSFPLL